MRKFFGVIAGVALMAAGNAGAQGMGTLYDTGPACCGLDGAALPGGANFTLGAPGTITGFEFYSFTQYSNPNSPRGYTGPFNWALAGPGGTLASGSSAAHLAAGYNATDVAPIWWFTVTPTDLNAGIPYIFSVSTSTPNDGSTFDRLYWNTTPGPHGDVTTNPAFVVLGATTAPEPSSAAMLTAGLLGVVPFLRKRRRA